jgi:hypothetical protein
MQITISLSPAAIKGLSGYTNPSAATLRKAIIVIAKATTLARRMEPNSHGAVWISTLQCFVLPKASKLAIGIALPQSSIVRLTELAHAFHYCKSNGVPSISALLEVIGLDLYEVY